MKIKNRFAILLILIIISSLIFNFGLLGLKKVNSITNAITISGFIFDDINNNGTRDSNEYELSGWTIYLRTGSSYPGTLVTSTASQYDGTYSFGNLNKNTTYYVELQSQAGWSQTYPTSPNYYTINT
jgi:hypothetical protein